jgi:hypothetical protein
MTSNAEITHCIHGHPFDEANTYWTKRGQRDCRACARDRAKHRPSEARYLAWRANTAGVERANALARERYRSDPEYRELRRARVRASVKKRRDAEVNRPSHE